MELNINNNINIDSNCKSNGIIQNFINELSDFLEDKVNISNEMKDLSIIDRVQEEQKVTVEYRDKMLLERSNILNNYAKQSLDKGTMYYIYSNDFDNNSIYNLCICEEAKSHNVIQVDRKDLPNGTGVDSALRIENGKYILDVEATYEISKQTKNMIDRLLEEQTKYLNSKRIEGHIYEVGEKEIDRVWLFDITKNDANGIEGIEEIEFSMNLLNEVTEGDKVEYINGRYQMYNK